jgi:predicted aspartyl protease
MRLAGLPLLVLSSLIGLSPAAAFECTDISLPSSIVICSNSDLTRLADERQQVYDETRSRLAADQQTMLWEDQKAWVRSYATACGVPPDGPPPVPAPPSVLECFKRSAEARIAYLRAYGHPDSASSEPASALRPATERATGVDEVPLIQAGQLLKIPVQINGAIILDFIIDSGASDVQIPFDVFSTLVRANTIENSDIIGEQTYRLADGSTEKSPRFLIRELKIGRQVLYNVTGSVGSPSGSLLLGKSFLTHFDSWTLDNKRHVLQLVGKTDDTPGGKEVSANSDHYSTPMASLSAPDLRSKKEPSSKTAMICGKPVEYSVDEVGGSSSLVGIWTGNWNNTSRLCGGMIVQAIDSTRSS